MTNDDYQEIDAALESVFAAAMEAHTIDPKVRESLPDECFALVTTDDDGKVKRSYPLRVPGDKAKTQELISKAVAMFHYAKPDQKKQLAEAIVRIMHKENPKMQIGKRNQIFRYVDPEDFPKSVTIVEKEQK